MAGDVARTNWHVSLFAFFGTLMASVAFLCASAPTASALPEKFFGLHFAPFNQSAADLEAVARSGAKYYHLQVSQTSDVAATYDDDFQFAWERGITILPYLYGKSSGVSAQFPEEAEWQQTGPGSWINFVYEVVHRYGFQGDFWNGKANPKPVPAWEVWNEPNLAPNNPGGDDVLPNSYAKFARRTAIAIQDAQSERSGGGTRVNFGNLFSAATNQNGSKHSSMNVGLFLQEAQYVDTPNSEIAPYFQGLALHPYSLTGGKEGVRQNVEFAREKLDQYFSSSHELWITELGWLAEGGDAAHPSVGEAAQSQYLTESFNWIKNHQAENNIRSLIYFNYHDYVPGDWASHAGLRKTDDTFRPAWDAFQEQTGAAKWPLPPTVETSNASNVQPTEATASGAVDAKGLPTSFQADYGTTTAYGSSTGSVSAGFGDGPVAVQVPIKNLKPDTVYHVRIAATNANKETKHGADKTFKTPPSTTTTAEITQTLNGNPGWVSFGGEVKSSSGTINGAYVNVILKKKEGGEWVIKDTSQHPVVNNNHFSLDNYRVGKGEWKVKIVFPTQGSFFESETGEIPFTIKDGYQLVNKYSEKCMDIAGNGGGDGAELTQWECKSPMTQLNQVFTLVPQGNSYYEIVARHSGKCMDVIGWSQSNGATIGQWTCNGASNQSWQGIPVSSEHVKFKAKFSNKCMDVIGWSKANGASVSQWDCGSASANQLWSFKSVESAPVPTKTFLTVGELLNGQPGYVSVSGNVSSYPYSVSGEKVNVNFSKLENGNWVYKDTIQPTINGSHSYSWAHFGVGVGKWRVKTVYPGNGALASSESGYHEFQIRSGDRLIARHSGKCMSLSGNNKANGTAIIQWDCSPNPSPGDGQVFTFVPMGAGYYELRINSSNKCVDVTGAGTGDGVKLQQWDCLGGPAHQLWRREPIQGQPPWFGIIAKHSGKCADVEQTSTANGMKIHQWSCIWAGNQQWKTLGVD